MVNGWNFTRWNQRMRLVAESEIDNERQVINGKVSFLSILYSRSELDNLKIPRRKK
jgi:hypothetical protein